MQYRNKSRRNLVSPYRFACTLSDFMYYLSNFCPVSDHTVDAVSYEQSTVPLAQPHPNMPNLCPCQLPCAFLLHKCTLANSLVIIILRHSSLMANIIHLLSFAYGVKV